MDVSDVFMSDPFLSLDNDLDDVSEVIRSNIICEKSKKGLLKGVFDESRTPSPMYLYDSEVFVPQLQQQQQPIFSDEGKKQKEIGQIVSLLQDDVMLGSALNNFEPYHSTTQFNNYNTSVQSVQNCYNMHNRLLSLSEYPTESNINNESNNLQNAYLKTQSYFVDVNGNDMNFGATVSTDLTINSPIKNNNNSVQLKNHSNQNNFTFFETTHLNNAKLLSPTIERSASNGVDFTLDSSVLNHSQYTNKKVQNLLNNRYSTLNTNLISSIDDDMLKSSIENSEIISPDDSMIHSGFPEEIIQFGSTDTTTISSPSLSDVIFSVGGTNVINGYFESSPPPPPSTMHPQLLNNIKENLNDINLAQNAANEYATMQNESNLNIEENKHLINQNFCSSVHCQLMTPKTTKYETLLPQLNSSINHMSMPLSKKSFDNSNLENTNNTKTELIKMLLEMTPNELENLRASKNKTNNYNQNLHSLPPSDPPPTQTVKPEIKRSTLNTRQKLSKKNLFNLSNTITESGKTLPETLKQEVSLTDQMSIVSKLSTNSSVIFNTLTDASTEWKQNFAECDDSDETDSEILQSTNKLNVIPISSTKKGPKTERRTAHNLIEKKYRCSINDRINHLKEMLASDESKLSKSATLRKAIEHINALRAQNAELTNENKMLHLSLKKAGIPIPSLPTFVPTTQKFTLQNPKVKKMFTSQESINNSLISTSSTTAATLTSIKAAAATSIAANDFVVKIATNTKQSAKKVLSYQSRVSLCVFMFVMLSFNPLSIIFSSDTTTKDILFEYNQHDLYSHHRTLQSIVNNPTSFDDKLIKNEKKLDNTSEWLRNVFISKSFVWLLNTLIVLFVLMRLLIYGEPVADKKSASWSSFVITKQLATRAIATQNYREAQRQLLDSLQILGRPLPKSGGFEEIMLVIWQIIWHVLNGIWVGRWLARRRRSAVQTVPVVCKSHAATALVYHQLHQLYLMGINSINLSALSGLNLSLAAVNLAESAGVSRDGITHRLRAEIYINAALRVKLNISNFFGKLAYAYFLRRARRHVRKAQMIDGTDICKIQWIFHPIAQKFLFSYTSSLPKILQNSKTIYFPFSETVISPKPIDCITSAFKMHLLTQLMQQLAVLNISSNKTESDFIEISHLLLDICTSQTTVPTDSTNFFSKKNLCMIDWCSENEINNKGDELCTWWAHLITCGIYWQYGDNTNAQKHYALVRKCPNKLLNNDLALSIGLAFCTRKMCINDHINRNFTNMVWMHTQRSFFHLEKNDFPKKICQNSNLVTLSENIVRNITSEWLMTSILDIWNHQLSDICPCWTQCAPNSMRQLYKEIFNQFNGLSNEYVNQRKIIIFKMLERVLTGANPIVTWRMFKALVVDDKTHRFRKSTYSTLSKSTLKQELKTYDSFLYYHINVLQRLQKDFCNNCNLILD